MAVPLRSRGARDVQAGAVTAPELEWIEPLLWADPPGEVPKEILAAATAHVATRVRGLGRRCYTDADTFARSASQRMVMAELNRRLVVLDIMVEGLTW